MKKVIIYSAPHCAYCHMAKDWLKESKIEYVEHDISADAQKREEIIQKTGQMGVPVIEVDGDIVIGFDKERLIHLLGI